MNDAPLIPFIPAWLDDAKLSQAEFRIYCHLRRRADNTTGIAWPSYESMQETCGVGRATVHRTLASLQSKGLIEKAGKPFGGSCRYRVIFNSSISSTIDGPPIVSPEARLDANSLTTAPIEAAPIVSPQNCIRVSGEASIVSPEAREGNPSKVIQLRVSNKEFSLEGLAFADWFKSTLPEQTSLGANWQNNFAKIHDDAIRLDGRTSEEIRAVSEWARKDSFWQTNFMSPAKLRSRNKDGILYFDVLAEKMKSSKANPGNQGATTVNLGRRFKGMEENIPLVSSAPDLMPSKRKGEYPQPRLELP
ncbi:MAG: helix-turn-helix domain-containing protein [Verrucomicrobiaceae bacterium]|nr:MAG: helix-turn-helix domain-containing protein [Verrucomicrobiaceae bacterium]